MSVIFYQVTARAAEKNVLTPYLNLPSSSRADSNFFNNFDVRSCARSTRDLNSRPELSKLETSGALRTSPPVRTSCRTCSKQDDTGRDCPSISSLICCKINYSKETI